MEARIAYVRLALRDDRLRLDAQPIVDLHSGETIAEELLLRFVRQDGTVELPGPFVRAAECYRLGAGLALDDFGTRYGSLSYLRRLPVTMLKIDREFVADIATDYRSRALVEAIVHMARRLRKQTAAEGVEDQSTVVALRECGVDFAQGFHIARPTPVR